MKRLFCVLMTLTMLAGLIPAVTFDAEGENYSQYNITYYDASIYTKPYWEGNVVVNECVFPLRAANGSLQPFKLTYPATQIIAVRNYNLTVAYTYGIDYTLNSAGELVILPGGSITTYDYRYIHPNTNPNNYDWDVYYPHRVEDGIEYPGWEFWQESSTLSNQTICVTYIHEGNSYITRPDAVGDALPRTMEKLTSGSAIRIVTTGDSVTAGALASAQLGISPSAPAYPQMTAQGLAVKFGNPNITLINSGIGGTTSSWRASTLNNTIISKNPDLVTICFGMNDSSANRVGLTDSEFYNNMKGQINYIKSNLPNCEILLVSSLYGNYYTFPRERYESHARILHELAAEFAGQGVAVCDPQAIESQILTRKVFIDFMADNMVHPNDFGMRLISQTIIDSLRYSSIEESASSAVARIRASVSPARGKDALYESMLSGFYDYFITLSGDTEITAAIPAKTAELEAAMQYCADGYHAFSCVHVDPLCGVAGKTSEVCSYCGYERNITVIPAIEGDHVFGAAEVTLTATAFNTGTSVRRCTKCGFEEETVIPRTSNAVNHAFHASYAYNYMQSNIYPYASGNATIAFDVVPIDVTERSSPSGPSYFGIWLGSSYTVLVGYDFTLQKFVVGASAMTYSQSMTDIYAQYAFAWQKKANGNYPMHRFAINVKGNQLRVYADGNQIIYLNDSRIGASKTKNDLVLAYTKGEFILDNFIISNSEYNVATGSGSTLWSSNFENGMTSLSSWTLDGGAARDVREFDMKDYYPDDHVHSNVLVASHGANSFHGSYDEYECSVCHNRTIVDTGTPIISGHVLIPIPAVAPGCTEPGNIAYWYCSDCGKYYTDSAGENETDAASVVAAPLGHDLVHIPAVEASASSPGHIEYWQCSRCGKTFSDASGSTEISVVKSEAVTKAENLIASIGEVKYQETESFTGSGMIGTFTSGDGGACYSVFDVGEANTKLNADYTIEMTIRVRNVDTSTLIGGKSGAFFGMYCESFTVGYDFASDQWGMSSNAGLWNAYAFEPSVRGQYGVLDDGVFHDLKMEFTTSAIRVYVDGVCMLDSSAFVRRNYNYCIFYPRLCTVDFASYALKYNGSWVSDHLTGSALVNASTWVAKGSSYSSAVRSFTGSRVVDSGAAIAEAEAAYAALSASERAQVSNYRFLTEARNTYNRAKTPLVSMSGTPDSSKISANLYFALPNRADARNYAAAFGGTSALLSTMTPTEYGYRFSSSVNAKNLTDSVSYSMTDFYGNTVRSGQTSVADYARVLAGGEYGEDVADVAYALLVYGGAAQRYFGYATDRLASIAEPETDVSLPSFGYGALVSQCSSESIPATYNSINVSFVSDTILWVSFEVKDGFTANQALSWVNSNVTLGGRAVSGSIDYNADQTKAFVVIQSANIPIDRITENVGLTVAGTNYELGVYHYIKAAQSSENEDLVRMTKALYAYALAAEALG